MNNHRRVLYNYLHRKIKVNNPCVISAIELTNFCDLSCSICPRPSMTRPVGFMDYELFTSIIAQCRQNTDFVWLHLFGEPLYHPRLCMFIDHCADQGIACGISTNANILDDAKAQMLLDSKLSEIYLCLDAVDKEAYDRIRCQGDFYKTRQNIYNFLQLKKQLNKKSLQARVIMVDTPYAREQSKDFFREWEGLADSVTIKPFTEWAGQVKGISAKGPQGNNFDRQNRYPCIHFWRSGIVHWNGDVVPCCFDFDAKMVLGNLRKERLEEIWNSQRMQQARREQCENNIDNPLCSKCREWEGYEKDCYYPLSQVPRKLLSLLSRTD
jgi:radical SAM protein with 4Fe4S-binding SPASM domain